MSFKIKHLGKQYKIDLTQDHYDIKEISHIWFKLLYLI
jgi:hypothetical protein